MKQKNCSEKNLRYPATTPQTSLPGAVVTGPDAIFDPPLLCYFYAAKLILENLEDKISEFVN